MEDNFMTEPTYAPKAVMAELKQVRWPSFKTLMQKSGLVILFTLLFSLYFFICEICASVMVCWIVSL